MRPALYPLSYDATPEAEVGFEPTRKSVLQTDAFDHLATQPFASPDEVCTRNLHLERVTA